MQRDANTVLLRYRVLNEGVPSPQPIRLQVPGWAGEADKMVNGAKPQPWHCRPYSDAAVYGLELRFPGNAEYAMSREAGALVLRKDGIPLPTWQGEPFGAFSPDHYGVAFCVDIEAPTGFVLRVEPHPRFYTDRTGNVPAAIPAHIGPFWTQDLFLVFKNPLPNEFHVFSPGLPYAQAFPVPDQAKFHAELLSQRDQDARIARAARVKGHYRNIGYLWRAANECWFDNKYKRLSRAFRVGGNALVEKEVARSSERSEKEMAGSDEV